MVGILKVVKWGGDTCFSRFGYLVAVVSSAMSERELAPAIAQRIIVKFLTNEGVIPSKILTRLRAQFGDMTLSSTQVYDWASKFKGGREAAENESHNRRPRTSLTDDNIRAICDLIEGDRRLTVDEIASEVNMSWNCTFHYHGAPWVQQSLCEVGSTTFDP